MKNVTHHSSNKNTSNTLNTVLTLSFIIGTTYIALNVWQLLLNVDGDTLEAQHQNSFRFFNTPDNTVFDIETYLPLTGRTALPYEYMPNA